MFGFGIWEIALLVGLLVLVFGTRRTGDVVRKGLEIHGQVNKARGEVRSLFSLDSLLGRNRDRKP